ncbi:NAD(P)-binding Rossmann-fold superfamily protein [Striga asiatica]|uniref:NAD(P)-binding Rossmann-fold superfamily protein n=1 Tax=Striga asiatica TaxID=4170 RepID=A0A5A7R9A4_STRAF|nr:NAD(P)-binding Rossmann-fold superfamily protein [Striga asiatica]
MGCFFGCFRSRDSILKPIDPPTEPVVSGSKNALSSLFECDDEPIGKGEEGQKSLGPGELDMKVLKEEANLLKACGTLPETPVEIRKALEKWESKSDSLGDSPSSCITEGWNPRRGMKNVITSLDMPVTGSYSESSAVSQQVLTPDAECKAKPVRFECDSESSAYSSKGSSEFRNRPCKQFGSANNTSVPKPSPYTTPLKLSDEVQTPCTNFSDKINMFGCQKEDDVMLTPVAESAAKQITVGKETKIEASLSDWLKPVSHNNGANIEKFGRGSREKVNFRKTPGDRPILGMVAAHWNEDETPQVPPKWFDGNGIPNSTNKYKEDQKVSWHATPFEERLEKALSEETFISKRKPIGMTPSFDFGESEESDTAFSHMQSSDRIKSVVSF